MNGLLNNENQIKAKAQKYRESIGGTIFSFPVQEDNPFSEYAVVVYAAGQYFVYPQANDISLAAIGVLTILDKLKQEGLPVTYESDVRFISQQAQIDAPDVNMRRLKKNNISKPLMEKGADFQDGSRESGPILSARGTLKVTYFSMVDEHNRKASQAMNEYYKFLAMKRYGKTAAAIKREVDKMGKEQAIAWLEQTYAQYINDPADVFNLFQLQ